MSSSNSQPKITILILAAGESKRMGTPKQLLKWGDSSLLNHSIEQAINSKANEVYVILGANYERIKSSITQPSVTVFNNKEWSKGMGGSISFGVNQLKDKSFDSILLMLVDQPQVDTRFLNKLIDEFKKGQKPIIATTYKRGAGVPAIFDKSYFDKLTSLNGDKGGKQLINENLSDTSCITPARQFSDIDTIEAYKKLHQQYFNEA